MGLSREEVTLLVDAFEQAGWTEMVLHLDGTRLELSSTGRPPQASGAAAPAPVSPPPGASGAPAPSPPADAPAPAPAPAAPAHGLHEVLAPSVGIFYRAPEPGAPPFVEAGRHVEPGDVVCIVEVMKLMNHVTAGLAGVVREVHVENGTMIEHGQRLFSIEVDA